MTNYCIVSAKPKGATNHVKSEFKMWMYNPQTENWNSIGWKNISDVSSYLQAGHSVRTGKTSDGSLTLGASVELELRISKNDTNFKISDMPST